MRQRRVVTALAIPLVLAFVAASCGSDDSSSDTDTGGDTTEAPDATDGEGGDDGGEPAATVPDVDTSVAEETDEAVYGGTVTIGLEADATGLRPWEDSCSSPCYTIMRSIYDPLFDKSAEGNYEPFLAESMEANDDFTVWTMTLRPDVTFHNGTLLTAQTIADMFPIQQAGASGQSDITGSGLAGVAAIDELTVEYTLSAPNVAFRGTLANAPLGFPFDPAAAAADPVGYSTNPIGTGPFVMANRDQDNETVVERNPDYWYTDTDGNQLPFLDSVSFRPTADEGTRLDALISGTTNAMQTLRQNTIRDAREESGIELIEFQGNSTGGGMFNTEQVPFDDARVRTGLIYMNNQENVIEALGGAGISLPTSQFFSADSPWWTQEAEDAYKKFDFDAGKALIQQYVDDPARSDGKAPGEKIDVELSCPPDPTLIAAMQVAEQVWTGSELVNVTLTQFDQATHINNAVSDVHHAHCWRWGTENDPSVAVNPFVAPKADSIGNFTNFDDPEMQAWATEASATDDFETRKALYGQIMTKMEQRRSDLVLRWYCGMIAKDPNVKGFDRWTFPDGQLGAGIVRTHEARWFQVFVAE